MSFFSVLLALSYDVNNFLKENLYFDDFYLKGYCQYLLALYLNMF